MIEGLSLEPAPSDFITDGCYPEIMACSRGLVRQPAAQAVLCSELDRGRAIYYSDICRRKLGLPSAFGTSRRHKLGALGTE